MIYKLFITSAIVVGSIWYAVLGRLPKTAADIKTILVQSLVHVQEHGNFGDRGHFVAACCHSVCSLWEGLTKVKADLTVNYVVKGGIN